MSLFAAKRFLKSTGKQIPENDRSIKTHTSSSGLNFRKTKVARNFTNQKGHSSFASDIKHIGKNDCEIYCTSKMQKLCRSGDSQEPVVLRSAANSSFIVRGHKLVISDHSNASKKAIRNVNSPRQTKRRCFVKGSSGGNGTMVVRNMEPSINLNAIIVQEDRDEVQESLKLFREQCNNLLVQKEKGLGVMRVDLGAVKILKKEGKWICREKQFGHIPGIAISDQFNFRAELHFVGLHCQFNSGIDYMKLNGKNYAVSVVDSGRYENKAENGDVLMYSGQGGHELFGRQADQKLERGNLALTNNIEAEYPVRVIRKITNTFERNAFTYVYDGLYVVKRYWQERDRNSGKLAFKFELHRMGGQERLSRQASGELTKASKECCVKGDVSDGKENFAISVMNGIDCDRPPNFTYITEMIYPERFRLIQPRGCNCIDGCLVNLGKCPCVLKNGGEIPFNEKGSILGLKGGVFYECGPFCKCPSSCMNRVSQHGLRYRLELFKIDSENWGVRSRGYISSGSFVCEFLGKLRSTEDTNKNISLWISMHSDTKDLDGNYSGFIIDAGKFGNVARFIRCSGSPNLFVQHVLYDNDDDRIPHVMFFAAKNITPQQELTCDFSEPIGEPGQWQYKLEL